MSSVVGKIGHKKAPEGADFYIMRRGMTIQRPNTITKKPSMVIMMYKKKVPV